jgi:hypothetical protein
MALRPGHRGLVPMRHGATINLYSMKSGQIPVSQHIVLTLNISCCYANCQVQRAFVLTNHTSC